MITYDQALALEAKLIAELDYRDQMEALTFDRPATPLQARAHLLPFVRWGMADYLAGWFHALVCERLEAFARDLDAGLEPRLIITAPPRHGKSELVSRRFPVWFMGTHPGASVGVCSYGQDLADDMSRDARRIRDEALVLWPHLAPAPRGVDRANRWDTQGGGSYLAAGVGGPLTGRGFSLGIIDDPVKNMAEADSQVERDNVWAWFLSTFYTRRAPKAGLLVMATRWHEDDLIGRLLRAQREGGERWEVVEYPALAAEDEHHPQTGRLLRRAGEALHPERYSQANMEATRGAVSARVWEALYGCRPTSKAGRLFKRAWYDDRFTFDPQRPPRRWDEVVISIDCNFKKAEDSAFVSVGVWGRWHGDPKHYRLDEARERWGYAEMRTVVRDLIHKWRPNAVLIEEAANGFALIEDLKLLHPGVVAFKPSEYGSKEARAEVASPTHESGCIALPHAAPWVSDWVEEHCAFPTGVYKDRVDESSQLVIYLAARARDGSTDAVISATRTMLGLFGAA